MRLAVLKLTRGIGFTAEARWPGKRQPPWHRRPKHVSPHPNRNSEYLYAKQIPLEPLDLAVCFLSNGDGYIRMDEVFPFEQQRR